MRVMYPAPAPLLPALLVGIMLWAAPVEQLTAALRREAVSPSSEKATA